MEFGKKNQRLEHWYILCVKRYANIFNPFVVHQWEIIAILLGKFQMQKGCCVKAEFGNYSSF